MNQALIIIDVQNDYFEGGTNTLIGSDQACENARQILLKFRKSSMPVIFIQHIAVRPDATFFLPNTHGVEIHPKVQPLAEEKVFVKHYPNSFRDTELLTFLTSNNITDLVICGMMTHMCVDATARAAKDFGFNCTIIGDACSTKNLEINGATVAAPEVQKAFLAALNYFYATVKTTAQFLK